MQELLFTNSKHKPDTDAIQHPFHIKRFEAYETIGGLFDRTVNGAMELSVTERIWELILQIVAVIAELFSADEEEIIRMIAYDNPKINIIKDLCGVKKTA